MLVILINIISVCPSSLFQFWLVHKLVPMRCPKLYIWGSTVFQAVLWTLNNYILPKPTTAIDTIVILSSFCLSWLFAKRGYRMRAMLAMVVYMAVMVLGNYAVGVVAYPIAESMGYAAADLNDKYSYANVVMCWVCTAALCPAIYCTYLLLKRIFTPNNYNRWVLLFLPILVSQELLVNIINRLLPATGQIIGVSLTLTLAVLLCLAADICFFIGVHKIQRGNLLETQVQAAEEQLNIQANYYRQLQDNILLVNQIRHDLNNQLQAAYCLLETGSTRQVRQQLDVLQNCIHDRVGPQYCSNLMVDAVLTEKAKRCRELNVQLDINAQLPPDMPIENTHLCSVFSNLLDNSIHGTQESDSSEKIIELRTSIQKDYLVVHCTNPAKVPDKKKSNDPLRQHGLGLGILERLAIQYNGSLDTVYTDKKFHTTLILRFPEQAKMP